MRQLLCSILLLIFCMQLLPIRAIGKILYSQTLQEEIPHSDDKPVNKTGKGLETGYLHNLHSVNIEDITYLHARHLNLHPSERMVVAHWLETFSPPPEFS